MHTSLPLPHIQAIVVPNAALLWRRCLVVVATMLVASALPQGVKAQDGDYGNGNTAEGTFALKAIVSNSGNTGSFNTAIGYAALTSDTTGRNNVASGDYALAANMDGIGNTANGSLALRLNVSGRFNTATGYQALKSNLSDNNTATGYDALFSNTNGSDNTANGVYAILFNNGSQNTAVGAAALYGQSGSTGSYNTASGFQSLYSNAAGGGNVADGWQALYSNTSGQYNTASGVSALRQNTTGNNNSAMGTNALYHTNGSNNVVLGYAAGQNLTTGSNNIIIGANVLGASADANVTRIGNTTQKKVFIGGISGKTVASGVGVIINSNGQLGTVQSSARYKDDIKRMDKASEAILALKPVTFRYKEELDPEKIPQFGLIAEEVEKVNPDLVVRGEDGRVNTVRYEAVNAMLLNEFLKAHHKVEEQRKEFEATIAQQQSQIDALTVGLQKVRAQLDAN